tara:strand:+ start:698 stop:3598 length:2901 start_codon:yes stop_codon:yes gene_type:complete
MKTKGKIENPMGVKSLIFTENEVRLGVDAVVLGNYNATSLTPYISVGDSSYFMDNLVNTDPILQLTIPENYGNTIFSNTLNIRTICLELDGNKSDADQPIPTESEHRMIYIDDGKGYEYGGVRNESRNYGWQPVSNEEIFTYVERSDLDGFDYPQFTLTNTRKIPTTSADTLCGPIFFTGETFNRSNYNWFFGDNVRINFNPTRSGGTEVILSGSLISQEGCASISDSNGEILFYTNGENVYDKNGGIMLNGDGLESSGTSTQSSIIVPLPTNNNQYYLFTTDFNGNPNGFEYSIVDMNLNDGLGAVTTKNIKLIKSPLTEKVTATLDNDNQNYWVVTHTSGDTNFYSYKLTPSGLQSPVVTSIGTINDTARGYMKISPDGSKLISLLYDQQIIDIFDFNNTEGRPSNHLIISGVTYDNGPYGLEFSSDSSKFYVSDGASDTITQYNLSYTSTTEIINNSITLPTISGASLGALQMGPDENIYIADANKPYLHRINYPNGEGLFCNLQIEEVNLTATTSGITSQWGLPNSIPDYDISCDRDIYITSRSQQSLEFKLAVNNYNNIVEEKQLDFRGVVYRYDAINKEFITPVHEFTVNYEDINVSSASTITIPLLDIGETEFIVKGYWEYPLQTLMNKQLGTTISNRNAYERGKIYGLYNPETDWYFLNMYVADRPYFTTSEAGEVIPVKGLVVTSNYTEEGVSGYTVNTNTDPIVCLNGSVLMKEVEYTFTTDFGVPMIYLTKLPLPNQVLTMAYVENSPPNSLYVDSYIINEPIISGANNTQTLSDKVFFNETYQTYEYYLDSPPQTDVGIAVNGSVLKINDEYLLSASNNKRVIITKELKTTDVITAFYTPAVSVVGNIQTNQPTITWSINNPPINLDGIFVVEFTDKKDTDFENVLYSGVTNYRVATQNYSLVMNLYDATVGDEFLYRIINKKFYNPIMGQTIVSESYSDVINVKIATNNGINY